MYNMKCPKCNSSESVLKIIYGYPGPEMQLDYYEGKIRLGGCEMSETNPDYHCGSCKYEWQRGKRNQGFFVVD